MRTKSALRVVVCARPVIILILPGYAYKTTCVPAILIASRVTPTRNVQVEAAYASLVTIQTSVARVYQICVAKIVTVKGPVTPTWNARAVVACVRPVTGYITTTNAHLIIAAFIPIARVAMRIKNALTENACASLVIMLTSTELAC